MSTEHVLNDCMLCAVQDSLNDCMLCMCRIVSDRAKKAISKTSENKLKKRRNLPKTTIQGRNKKFSVQSNPVHTCESIHVLFASPSWCVVCWGQSWYCRAHDEPRDGAHGAIREGATSSVKNKKRFLRIHKLLDTAPMMANFLCFVHGSFHYVSFRTGHA